MPPQSPPRNKPKIAPTIIPSHHQFDCLSPNSSTVSSLVAIPHRLLPTAVVDSEVPDERRFLSDDKGQSLLRPEVLIGDYLTVQLTRHEDFFDWERSQFKRPSQHLPDLLLFFAVNFWFCGD
jgi:hypothetical protein